MKRWKSFLVTLLAMIFAIVMFGACSQKVPESSDTANSKSNTPNKIETSSESKNITMRISWWGADVRHKATLEAIDTYMAKNAGVKIEAEYQGFDGYQQKMMTQLAGGTAPDLVQIDNVWLMELSTQQKVLFDDLNNFSDIIDTSIFDEEYISGYCSYDGHLLGIPLGTNGSGLMTNKEFMERFNIPLDTQFTWDSIIEIGSRVHAEDPNCYLMGIDPSSESIVPLFWEPYLKGLTGKYWIDDSGYDIDVTKEDIVQALTMIKKLYDSGAVVPMGETVGFEAKMEQLPKWVNGNIGGLMDWSSRVSPMKAAVGEDKFTTMNVPVVANGKVTGFPTKPSLLLAISNDSKYKEEAAKFINWVVSTEEAALILKDTRSIPTSNVSRDVLMKNKIGDPDVLDMVNRTLENPLPAPPYSGRNAEIVVIVSEVMNKVVYAQLTPEQGAEELTARVTAKLDTMKK